MTYVWKTIEFLSYVEWMLSLIVITLQLLVMLRLSKIWRKNREREAKARSLITLRLRGPMNAPQSEQRDFEIPYRPRRDQLSRSELLGILGMYYGRERFDSKSLRRILEDGDLDRVLAGDDPSSDDEQLLIPWADDPTHFDPVPPPDTSDGDQASG